jgi:hypothetical protein
VVLEPTQTGKKTTKATTNSSGTIQRTLIRVRNQIAKKEMSERLLRCETANGSTANTVKTHAPTICCKGKQQIQSHFWP